MEGLPSGNRHTRVCFVGTQRIDSEQESCSSGREPDCELMTCPHPLIYRNVLSLETRRLRSVFIRLLVTVPGRHRAHTVTSILENSHYP